MPSVHFKNFTDIPHPQTIITEANTRFETNIAQIVRPKPV